jgi:SEC-C motif-containing protein
MRSRYSAYALGLTQYIMASTHPNNPDASISLSDWQNSIAEFSKDTQFIGLNILEFINGEDESYVVFEARLNHGTMKEKSRFLKVNGKWLYESGSFD